MGNSPSQELYYGARSGDVPRMEKALRNGADINYRHTEKRGQTSLIVAAKHGQLAAVRLLLARGALDYRSTDGQTAMHEAARMGHDRVVALLLDRGSDHFSRNTAGERAIDRASFYNHVSIVRLIEARTCPFFGTGDMEQNGWFSNYYEPRWLTIHRARPTDNPAVSRSDYKLCIFTNQQSSIPEYEFIKPHLAPISTDEENNVIFDLTPETILYKGRAYAAKDNPQTAHKIKPFRFKLNREMYNWMNGVLSPSFMTGRGPAFEADTGFVRMPVTAKAYIQNFSHLSAADVVGHAAPVALSQHISTPVMTTNVSTPAGAIPVALTPLPSHTTTSIPATNPSNRATAAPLQPLPIPTPTPLSPSSSSSSTAHSSAKVTTPSYFTATVNQLFVDLDNNNLHFDIDIPEEYLCSISTDLMIDPVVAEDGHTYSRTAITQWLQYKKTSPRTNENMSSDHLIPNHHLRGQILEWIENHRIKQSTMVPAPTNIANPTMTTSTHDTVRRSSTPSLTSDWVIVEAAVPVTQPPRISNSPINVGGSNIASTTYMGVPTPSRSYQPTSLPPLSPAASMNTNTSIVSNGIRNGNANRTSNPVSPISNPPTNNTNDYYTGAHDFPLPPTNNAVVMNNPTASTDNPNAAPNRYMTAV